MNDYNLKYRYKDEERGFWNTGIQAETDEEAIEIAKDRINKGKEVVYAELEKMIIRYKKIAVIKENEE